MIDPITAALIKATRPVDINLPKGWYWSKCNAMRGYFLCYSTKRNFYQSFFADEHLCNTSNELLANKINGIIRTVNISLNDPYNVKWNYYEG